MKNENLNPRSWGYEHAMIQARIFDETRTLIEGLAEDPNKLQMMLKVLVALNHCDSDEQFDAISRFADSMAHGNEHFRNEINKRLHEISEGKND